MYDSSYDSPEDDGSSDDDDAGPSAAGKRKRVKGPKRRLAQALGERLVFWCALCGMAKPVQSTKAIKAHRKGRLDCLHRPEDRRPDGLTSELPSY